MRQPRAGCSIVAQRSTTAISAYPQLVVKVFKYCNLRCDYCYEFPYLGDMARVSLDEIRGAFQNIKTSVDELAIESADFIFHGGEPFLVPPKYYEQVDVLKRTFW